MRGHLVKRAKNSWSIVLDLGGNPATGKRRQQWISIKGTKRDAEKRLAELIHQIDTGGFIRPARVTLGEFLHKWMEIYASSNVRARTLEGYRTIVDRHLVPKLGTIRLTALQPGHLQEYYALALSEGRYDGRGGLSARTVQHHHRLLSEALSHAVKWGLVSRNVAQAVDPPRPRNKEMNALDFDGVTAFLEAAKGATHYHLFHLDIYTGLRLSEILGLRWKDVDLDLATISVTQVMHRLRDKSFIFQEPKTAKSRRQIDLSPTAAIALRAYREEQSAQRILLGRPLAENDLVFAHPHGSPLFPSSVSRAFQQIARKVAIQGIRFHDLRHTHATLMLKQNVNPKVVQERLGHATFAITMDTYSHVLPGLQKEAAIRFEEGFRQPDSVKAQLGVAEVAR